ncbi:MAG: biotin--[acetyl-CoA-carboxylase] ligase [Myxococcota bacterium]
MKGEFAAIGGHMPLSITWYEQIESTQNPAMQAAQQGQPEGLVWVADHQTAGRGRLRQGEPRVWHAPPGSGLMFSLLLRPRLPPDKASALTLAVAVGCARALETHTTAGPIQLKWPNDLYLGGLKLGGILTEGLVMHNRTEALVVGVGINVNLAAHAVPEPIRGLATSLQMATGQTWDRLALLPVVVAQIRSAVAEVVASQGRLEGIAQAWEARSMVTGQRATIEPQGITGLVQGLAPDGGLLIEDDQGTPHTIRSGELTLTASTPEEG